MGVSDSLAQETSIRARIKSAEKRIIERVVFIEFWLVEVNDSQSDRCDVNARNA